MYDTWLGLLDVLLRPSRPGLARCLAERDRHLETPRLVSEQRARRIADCERRIEDARREVFAADDGVVTSRMTDLEREWRRLSRPDPEADLMDLWARIAPASWIDRKRWRDSAPAARAESAIALAADAENVEAAEAAIDALRAALAPHGTRVGSRIRWRPFERDAEIAPTLLAEPLRAARDACPAEERAAILEHATRVERHVHEATRSRFPDRPGLASDLAHAAHVDFVWRASALDDAANPVNALRALWKTGYVLSGVDENVVTVEIPAMVMATPDVAQAIHG